MNIIDYVKKYGGRDYDTVPFNDVDRLVLSQFSYLKFDGLIPQVGENGPYITLKQLANMPGKDSLFADERYAKNNRALFDAMAAHNRFSFLRLNYYINIIDEKNEIQFSALTVLLPDDFTFIVFRGTDESIIGWKEDLNMGFMTPVPAQEKAIDYVNYVSPLIAGDFSMGGHSKGGNLAVYAAMMCDEDVRSRIRGIYSYDGPGFTERVLGNSEFYKIKSRVHKFVPHSSLVGMLLNSWEETEVISCKKAGILQHDPFNWIVDGCGFVKKDEIKRQAEIQNRAVNKWIAEMTDEECRLLSDNIYEVFMRAGIDDLNDIYKKPADSMKKIAEALYDMEPGARRQVIDIIRAFADCFIDQAQGQLNKLAEDELDKLSKIWP